jgi:glycosyltransferase involved in cell wall biosynthesis
LKVLFASGYNPFHSGSGPGGCLHYLSKALAAIGCEVHILTPRIDAQGDLGSQVSIHYYKNPLEKYPIGNSFIPFSVFSVSQIKHFCSKYSIDVVHGHSPTTFVYSMMKDKKRPFVVSAHGTSFGEISSLYRTPNNFLNLSSIKDAAIVQPSWACLTNLEYNYADRVVAVSKAVADELVNYYRLDSQKISVVYNGVSVPLVEERGEENLILSIGRMVWRKGFLYLINAMPSVLKEYPKAKLVLVGEGIYKPKLIEQTKKLNIEHAITFCGYLPKEDLFKLYGKAHLYIQPSLYEPLCGTVLEAMACQKPVIATKVGGNREMIRQGENGVLVNPSDSKELAEAIKTLLSDASYCARIGKKAKETVEKSFSWESIAKETLKMYQTSIDQQ